MNHLNSRAITYSSGAILLSILLSVGLIYKLQWPASAEIPLCISIFIQLTGITKTVQNTLENSGLKSILDAYSVVKESTQ